MPAARGVEGAERRAAFWRTPGGRVLGVVSFVVLGLVGTRQLITHSTAALVAFGLFVVVIVGLALSLDPRARAGLIGALGVYFAVSGFAHFGGLHSTPLGVVGVILVLVTAGTLGAIARHPKQFGARPAEGGSIDGQSNTGQ
jgi:hypothetical protein